jgi:hypothetical protein
LQEEFTRSIDQAAIFYSLAVCTVKVIEVNERIFVGIEFAALNSRDEKRDAGF